MHRLAVGPAQQTAFQNQSLPAARAGAGAARQAAGRGQGFGPRPGSRRRAGGRQQAGGGGGGSARQAAAAAAGHNPQPFTLEEALQEAPSGGPEDPQQAQAQAAGPEAAEQEGGGEGGDMHGQPHYKAGLPSSRSDTMLLQSAEQQRYGLLGSNGGPGGPGLARGGLGQHSMPAVAAAVGAAAAAQGGRSGSSNSIPVFVMLPLDTVSWHPSHRCGTCSMRCPCLLARQGAVPPRRRPSRTATYPAAATLLCRAGERGRSVSLCFLQVV